MNAGTDETGPRRGRSRNPFISTPDPVEGGEAGGGTSGEPLGDQTSAEPGATTPATPAPATFGRAVVDVDGAAVVVAEMAKYDFATPPHEPLRLVCTPSPGSDGTWRVTLTWPAWTGEGTAVYRVIATDGGPPESMADNVEATLEVTTATSVVDAASVNPHESGVRHYEVWLHTGVSVTDAVHGPPFLYAGITPYDHVVWPPAGLGVTASGRDLVVSWEPLPDQRFRLLRKTQADARRGQPTATECDEVPPGGYQDTDVPAGQPFVYYVFAGVMVDDSLEWSAVPAIAPAELPVTLDAVTDLTVVPREESRVDLVWTSVPNGKVEIFTTAKAPPTDLGNAGQLTRDLLREYPYNLDLDRRMAHPVIHDEDGRSRMANVDVSTDAAAIYFVPITLHRQQARPGRPVPWLRALPPTDLVVVDRVQQVLVAFRWPGGAARVDLWRTPPDSKPNLSVGPAESLSREDYEAFGGFLISRERRMIASGEHLLHLAGYSSHGGVGKHSAPAAVAATFPALVKYQFVVEQRSAFLAARRPQRRLVLSSFETVNEATFTLVWSPDQLPLSSDDGRVLHRGTVSLPARQSVELAGLPELPNHGFVRLIADPFHDPAIALLDPDPGQLRLSNG